jgi:alpha-L-rhamnosidase
MMRLKGGVLWCGILLTVLAGRTASAGPEATRSDGERSVPAAGTADEPLRPVNLRTAYREDPLGIDETRPGLTWTLQGEGRARAQSAYRILVASSRDKLRSGVGDMWDTGKVQSDKTAHVRYAGAPLQSNERYFWKVKTWDESGNASAWSKPATWSMGLLRSLDWQGKWIGPADTARASLGHAAPMLRKEHRLGKPIERATAHVSGLGYYEFYLNGEKVSDRVLEPGFTQYRERVLYTSYDVTDQLRQGRNAMGALLGGGFFYLGVPDLFGTEDAPWTAPPRLLMQIEVEFEDGARRTIVTDDSWRWATGPITFNGVRGGETYDARKERPGWKTTGYDDADWQQANVVSAPEGTMVAQENVPVRVTKSIEPVEITEPKPGVYVFDLGVNITGWAKIQTAGPAGREITMKFNEVLNDDGTIDSTHGSSHTHGRYQTDKVILDGDGEVTYEPSFTFHGFRYVQVRGLAEEPDPSTITGRWVHSDLKRSGSFETSNERVNEIQDALDRTHLNYMLHYPRDPLREKMGWTQDVFNIMKMGIYNNDIAPLYRRWYQDMLDAQEPNGHLRVMLPSRATNVTKPYHRTPEWTRDAQWGHWSDPWWGGALVAVPWMWYQYYGDASLIEENFEAMRGYVDFVSSTADDYLVDYWLGDWLEVGSRGAAERTPVVQTTTSGYYHLARLVSKSAAAIDRPRQAKAYRRLADSIKTSFNEHFFDPETGLYAKDSQTSQVLPLRLGMVPDGKEDLVLQRLVENVKQRDRHLSTGFVGTNPLFQELTERGRSELVWDMAMQEDSPGLWFMLKDGGTTIWETWFERGGRSSHNMINIGGPWGEWFFQALGGIRPDPDEPGFKKSIIKPEVVGNLDWVEASYESVHGEISSAWRIGDGRLTLSVGIPANTTATVHMPVQEGDVREGGDALPEATGVERLRGNEERTVLRVGSGTYEFSTPWTDEDEGT